MDKKRSSRILLVAFCIIIAFALAGLWVYYVMLEKDLEAQAYTAVEQIKDQQSFAFKQGVDASLRGAYPANLDALLLPSYGGKGYALVVDGQGSVVAKTDNVHKVASGDNLLENWATNKVSFSSQHDGASVVSDVQQGVAGQSILTSDGVDYITHYGPVGVNDWSVFIVVEKDTVLQSAGGITNRAGLLLTLVVVGFALVSMYLLRLQTKSDVRDKEHITELERIAYVDELTGERNYAKFKIDAREMLNNNPDQAFTIVKIDIENFKIINQVYGHEKGNFVLQSFAYALHEVLTPWEGIFARVANDDFVMLHPSHGMEKEIAQHRLALKIFFDQLGSDFNYVVKFKAGQYDISAPRETVADINEYYELANFAHREAKRDPLTEVVFYHENMSKAALAKKDIENRMQQALESGEFVVHLQPKYVLEGETIGGAEALVRWRVSETELLPPAEFIGLFEENGFIISLDKYVLGCACKTIKGWLDQGIAPVPVSVNFSRLHLDNTKFVDELCGLVDSYGLAHSLIEIEITESAIFEHLEAFKTVLVQLHKAGFTLSMDDFGSGYSSLGLLKDLPVDVIKIDRSFFVAQQNDARTKTVIAMVLHMAEALSIQTVAEGVEEQEQVELLREFGCDQVQGFFYARPMPVQEFTRLLVQERGK
ncbi:MAG: EAL domain-containing protein [Raoultibacter sp.]